MHLEGMSGEASLRLHMLKAEHVLLPCRIAFLNCFSLVPLLYKVIWKEVLMDMPFFLSYALPFTAAAMMQTASSAVECELSPWCWNAVSRWCWRLLGVILPGRHAGLSELSWWALWQWCHACGHVP